MEYQEIKKAYRSSKNLYDDVLTQNKWWSKLYIRFFWDGVDDVLIAQKLLRMIPDEFCGKLLDVPVGTGVFTAEKYASLPDAKIVCLDYSPDMLQKAKQRLCEVGARHVECVQGDVLSLPFENDTFDVLISMNGFHAFPKKEEAFYETARVLRSGGLFCGCFYIKGECRRSDFVVNRVLVKKGWFTPPFDTLETLKMRLDSLYRQVTVYHDKSIAYFKCMK